MVSTRHLSPCVCPEYGIYLSGKVPTAVFLRTQYMEERIMFLTVAKLDTKDPGGSDSLCVTVLLQHKENHGHGLDSAAEIWSESCET